MLSNALIRRSPSTPYFASNDPFFRMVDRLFGDWAGSTDTAATSGWVPAVDIAESETAFMVTAELPGLTKKDIEVTLENNVMTLRGERTFENDENKDSYRRVERSYGAFHRSFTMPNTIDAEAVSAKFKDGLLTLTVPKAETARARTIKVA